jgi:hypothetical protein
VAELGDTVLCEEYWGQNKLYICGVQILITIMLECAFSTAGCMAARCCEQGEQRYD